MPLTPDPPFPKSQGDNIRSKDWNDAINEVRRLDTAKLNLTGGAITGPLNISGALGIGTTTPSRPLTIESGAGTFLNVRSTAVGGPFEVLLGADSTGGIVSTMTNHDLQLRAGNNDPKLVIKANGNVGVGTQNPDAKLVVAGDLKVTGQLLVPKTGGSFASFMGTTFSNESEFANNNVKLSMGTSGFIIIGAPPFTYEFAIGHVFSGIIIGGGGPSFIKRFSINQDGNAFFGGSKGGYVIDYFINAVGDRLELGDVVVLNTKGAVRYCGAHGNIPIVEADLTQQAYDARVCGIVADFVSAADLPSVDPDPNATTKKAILNPLMKFAGAEGQQRTEVQNQQMGRMVTLGAFAHCKVDADIAPINVGDLLTTSPTRGHAQKALDPGKAVGAILGKALGKLRKGQGKIPVMVLLH